jgi:hypothetical protein
MMRVNWRREPKLSRKKAARARSRLDDQTLETTNGDRKS